MSELTSENSGYEYRYTDSDVRKDARLRTIAQNYAYSYTGSFPPLVGAMEIARSGAPLPVAVARKVLNCMRSDHHYGPIMPRPEEQMTAVQFDKLIAVDRLTDEQCWNKFPHGAHRHGDSPESQNKMCFGVKRVPDLIFPAKLKVPFMLGKQGKLIHNVDHSETKIKFVFDYQLGRRVPAAMVIHSICNRANNVSRPALLSALTAFMLSTLEEPVPFCTRCRELALKNSGEEN